MTSGRPDDRPGAALVTGASGLLGGGVAARLRGEGVRVVATDIRSGDDVVACDVTDHAALDTLASREDVTTIIHCGGVSGPMVANDRPRSIVDVNVSGSANLLETARTHRMRRLVFCSSLTVYGTTGDAPVTEDTPTAPTSVYAASKVAGEALVRAYAAEHGVDGIALRIGTVYGPGRRTACFVRTMLDNARNRVPTTVPYGADFPRQYLYVDDAVEALYRAWLAPAPSHRVLNVTGGSYLDAAGVVDVASAVVPDVDVRFGTGVDPIDPDWQGPLSGDRAAAEIGYQPTWTLSDGIKAYAKHLQRAGMTHD